MDKEIIDSLHSAIVFSSHDWSRDKRLAWVYGIIVGWDDDSFEELKERFGWSDKTIERLKKYHEEIEKVYKLYSDEE